jgi:outer membrane protein
MKLRKGYLVLILLVFINQLNGQENKEILKLSVSEARDYALQYNRTIQAANLDISTAQKKVWETIATGLPQINFAANYQHQFQVPELSFGPVLDVYALPDGTLTRDDVINAYFPSPPIPLGVRNNTTFDFTLSQLIFSGEYLVGLQAMRVLKRVSELTLVKTEDQIEESVTTTYYLLLVLDENARVLQKSYESTEQTYKELVKMYQVGFNEETDVDQMKISLSNIETLLNSVESQKEITLKLLKYQLGVDFDQPVILTDSLSRIINQGNVRYPGLNEFQVEENIDYRLINNQEKISALMLRRQQSRLLPVISGFYRHQEQTNAPPFNFLVKDVAGITINLPIMTSGQRLAAINQAKFDLHKTRLDKVNVEQGLIMEYETARSDYETAYRNFKTNEETMTLSRKVYDRTVIKYKEGVSSSFELTQNQSQLLTAETNYYRSLLTLLNASAKLDRISGK